MITFDSDPSILEATPRPQPVRQVCACGHGVARHHSAMGVEMCEALRMACPCRSLKPVLITVDARVFMCSNKGQVHPLVAGILATRKRELEWSWLEGRGVCEHSDPGAGRCNAEAKAAVYLENGRVSELRCEEHAA